MVRYLQRSVRQTVVDYTKLKLTELGWVDDPVNFGAEPVQFIEVDRREKVERIDPTTVSIWIPNESADRIAELGGGLYVTDIDIMVDIYAQKAAYAINIGSDLKDIFRDRSIPLIDYVSSGSTLVEAGMVEFMGAYIDRPASPPNAIEFRGTYRTVRLYSRVWFED